MALSDFSCPEQLNRWPCLSLACLVWPNYQSESSQHYRVNLETCHLWDIWSEWWGDMTWPKNLPTHLPTNLRKHPQGAILYTCGTEHSQFLRCFKDTLTLFTWRKREIKLVENPHLSFPRDGSAILQHYLYTNQSEAGKYSWLRWHCLQLSSVYKYHSK